MSCRYVRYVVSQSRCTIYRGAVDVDIRDVWLLCQLPRCLHPPCVYYCHTVVGAKEYCAIGKAQAAVVVEDIAHDRGCRHDVAHEHCGAVDHGQSLLSSYPYIVALACHDGADIVVGKTVLLSQGQIGKFVTAFM